MTITVTNKTILEFYAKNPTVHFETINLIFIELFEKVFTDMNQTMYSTINAQILTTVTDLQSSVAQLRQDLPNCISLKLLESKREYTEDVRNIIQNSFSVNKDSLHTTISQLNEALIDKTKLTLSEILPRYNETAQKEIVFVISQFERSMGEELAKMKPEKPTTEIIDHLINNFENKFNNLLMNITHASEARISENINSEKTVHDKFRAEIMPVVADLSKHMDRQNEFFDKYKNSSHKGSFGENNLEQILCNLYQSAEIVNTSKETAAGDFILKRGADYSPILFENKDYSRNVPIDEVKKFVRDTETQNSHGIFLSQHSGITSKQNFQIETRGYNVLLYIHNAKYCAQTIKTAVDIIDSLADKIMELKKKDDDNDAVNHDFTMPREVLQDINKEIRYFIEKRESMSLLLKDFNWKMEKELKSIEFPSLCTYITEKAGSAAAVGTTEKKIVCDVCNVFPAHSNKSLAAHKRKCGKNKNTT